MLGRHETIKARKVGRPIRMLQMIVSQFAFSENRAAIYDRPHDVHPVYLLPVNLPESLIAPLCHIPKSNSAPDQHTDPCPAIRVVGHVGRSGVFDIVLLILAGHDIDQPGSV